eukprot:gnl/TRDRNA2_/TRDRNA2_176540_c3_seq25.p1 gnl/TRDRNA2_/TRDRNA2_176540_c3~~gnl/TRDRNA2_/TRDRNA2_176540_c3_seq25.p1  ORF type:complete len:178 (-),score=47.97 gnl/TRDRNA2_/TRDRNA2_176540_c3_seq25:375-908(-)
MATIHIAIRNVSGDESLELDLEPQTKISEVKKLITEKWDIPKLFQKLVLGDSTLQDFDRLDAHKKPDDDSLRLTMIISLEDAQKNLTSGHPVTRKNALKGLGRLGRKAGPDAITAVLARLGDADFDVKFAAVEALVQLAEQGHQHAITAVVARFADEDGRVRYAAVKALAQLAEEFD